MKHDLIKHEDSRTGVSFEELLSTLPLYPPVKQSKLIWEHKN
jgi:hypothetical protein